MGLENGIEIKKDPHNAYKGSIIGQNDVCYWRKCWGLRNQIIHYLEDEYNEHLEYPLKVEDVKKIRDIVESWYNKKRWNSEGESIWSWKEIKHNLLKSLMDLSYLIGVMENDDKIEVVFYDSY